jgi:hypothetical protein
MNTENVVESTETENVAVVEPTETVVHESVAAVIEGAKAKGKPGRKVVPGSGLQRAKEIYTRMAGAARSEVVAAFVADKIPKASANTYYHLIKNASNPS